MNMKPLSKTLGGPEVGKWFYADYTLEILSRAQNVQIDFEAAFFPKAEAENVVQLEHKNPLRRFLGL